MGLKFNPIGSPFDLVNKRSSSSGADNFSYLTVIDGQTITVPENQQMLVDGQVTVLGHLTVAGDLVDLSGRYTQNSFYEVITDDEVVVVDENRLLLYKSHLTVAGHLRNNGILGDVDTEQLEPANPISESGKVTLGVGGSATVNTVNAYSTSRIFLQNALLQINGKLHYDMVIDGVSFNIHTANNSDVGHVIDWMILN